MAVLCPLIGGIPYMLYVTKAKKFGMTAIMGFLIGLIMVFFGNGYLTTVSYTHLCPIYATADFSTEEIKS